MSYLQNRPFVAFQTTTPIGAGGTYDSGILKSEGYSQLQTELLSNADGTLTAIYYSDAGGTDTIRTLNVPYTSASGYQLYSAPVFSPYVRYQFTCPAGNTDFYYTTKFIGTSINPQLARLDAPLVGGMVSTVTRSIVLGQTPGGQYRNVSLDENDHLKVRLSGADTLYGEVLTASFRPLIQVDPTYGFDRTVETFIDTTPGTGSVTTANGSFICQTGAGVGGYAVIRSRRSVSARPGQTTNCRLTALFDTANSPAQSLQIAGAWNATNGFLAGMNGASGFGVMHRTNGQHEVRTLTLTVAAGGAENATLTLNSVAYVIPVTAGTTAFGAYQIATWLNANQLVWDAFQNGSTVVLFAKNVGPLAGTYSLASTGTMAGTIAQNGAGVVNTENWVQQANFSLDILNGSGTSGITIDPSRGNNYEIRYQPGYGIVDMRLQSSKTGQYFTYHQFKFTNTTTAASLLNGALKVGWAAASLGSAVNITVSGGGGAIGIDGETHPFTRPLGFSYQRASVGATLTSVFALRVRSEFAGRVQLRELLPKLAFVSPEGNKACEVKILLNPTFSGTTNWTYLNQGVSIMEYDTTGTTFSSQGEEVASFIVAGGSSGSLRFKDLAEESSDAVHLSRGDVLCIAARITGGAGVAVTASISWTEE